jgi:DNA-binding NarL/FixJ family response regulator
MTYQREIGDRQGLVWAWLDLARNAARAGDRSLAADSLVAGLDLARQLGDRLSMARAFEGIATLVSATDAVLAVRMASAASALRQTIGAAQAGAPVESALATARRALGAGVYDAARAGGRALPFERAVDEALGAMTRLRQPGEKGQRRRSSEEPVTDPLTRREREVATLLAQGLTDRQIAERLVISEGTVGVHVTHILAKLDVHSRAQIAVWLVGHPAT